MAWTEFWDNSSPNSWKRVSTTCTPASAWAQVNTRAAIKLSGRKKAFL